jgi:hypothetical protein
MNPADELKKIADELEKKADLEILEYSEEDFTIGARPDYFETDWTYSHQDEKYKETLAYVDHEIRKHGLKVTVVDAHSGWHWRIVPLGTEIKP